MKETYYICRKGVVRSAMKINQKPNQREMDLLSGMGFELARVGKRYRKNVRCPVNGDGYWYTRRYLLDSEGQIVGSFEDYSGPTGVF